MNCLYYGDNLDVVRRYIKDEAVDLVYLDPPFKSNQDYNVLFAEQDGAKSAAQIKAFEYTWRWYQGAAAAYEEAGRRWWDGLAGNAGFQDVPTRERHARLPRNDGAAFG